MDDVTRMAYILLRDKGNCPIEARLKAEFTARTGRPVYWSPDKLFPLGDVPPVKEWRGMAAVKRLR